MLRTTDKTVKSKLNEHILSYFDGDSYGNDLPAIDNLKDQMKSFDYMPTAYAGGRYMAEGGTFLVYYAEQREFLAEILDQTDSDQDKYSNNKVFDTYCHLIGRQVAELVEGK